MQKALLLAVVASFLSGSLAPAQAPRRGHLAGWITDAGDRQPLIGATVLVEGSVIGTTTDATGYFLMRSLPEGSYTVSVSMVGYRTARRTLLVTAEDTTRTLIALVQSAVQTQPVVVTASRRAQSLREVPASVSVVDSRWLAQRNAVTIEDALRYVPGATITRSQVNIRGSTGYSLGVGTRVLLLVDGLPFLTGDTGEIIWESVPVGSIERIEVVKGAGSALYGSSALGGVINVITQTPQAAPETKLRTYGGFYEQPLYSSWRWAGENRRFGGFSVSHMRKLGDASLSVGGSRTLDDGFRMNDFWKRWNAWARTAYTLSPVQTLTLTLSYMNQRRGNFLYWKDLDHAFEPKPDELGQRVESDRWNIASSYRHFLSERFFATVQASWFGSKWHDNIPNQLDSTGSASRSDFLVGEIQINYQPHIQHILTGGIMGSGSRVDAQNIFGRHTGAGAAFYLQDEFTPHEEFHITAGGRMDLQEIAGVEHFSEFNPKLAAVYTPAQGTSLRLAAGRGFRAPSVAEVYTTTQAGGITVLPNPGLQPERSWSAEAGVSQAVGADIGAEATLFRNEFWNLIEPTFSPDGNVRFQNITRARITGGEFTLAAQVLEHHLAGTVSYTILDPEDLTTGDVLKYRPRNLLTASVRLAVEPVQMIVDYRYLSRTERIDEEFVALGIVKDGDERVPVSVADLRLGSAWKFEGISLVTALHVNNLFQYYYVDLIGNMGPTRNYVLSAEATF